MNNKIKKLQKHKNYLLTLIHRWKKKFIRKDAEITSLERLLHDVKIELKHESIKSMNDYWEERLRNISHTNSKTFFSKINKVFWHKNQLEISSLKDNKIRFGKY